MKYPGFTMEKVRQISVDLDGFHCTNNDSCSGIDPVKNSSYTSPIGRCVQSCSNYCQSEVSMGNARQKQPKTRDCRISNSYSRIECTCLLEWH